MFYEELLKYLLGSDIYRRPTLQKQIYYEFLKALNYI